MPSVILTVDGENVTFEGVSGRPTNFDDDPNAKGTWKYGNFGEAHKDVAREAGKENYNIDINLWQGALGGKGIVSDDEKKLTFFGMSNAVDSFEWESNESIKAFKEASLSQRSAKWVSPISRMKRDTLDTTDGSAPFLGVPQARNI